LMYPENPRSAGLHGYAQALGNSTACRESLRTVDQQRHFLGDILRIKGILGKPKTQSVD